MLASMGPLTPTAPMCRLTPDSKISLPFRRLNLPPPLQPRHQWPSPFLQQPLLLLHHPSRISHRLISLPRMNLEGAMQNNGRPPLEPTPLLKRSNRIEYFARCAKSGSSSDKIAPTARTPGSSTGINAWLDSGCHVAGWSRRRSD